jgi:hypothetical protein
MSYEENQAEIASLLKTSQTELESGRPLAGLSLLFEAQFVLNELVQSAMENAVLPRE